MAIGTDDSILKYGTQDAVDSSSAAVLDDAFSVAGDVVEWENDDDAPEASFVLVANFSTAPGVNTSINLYARLNEVQATGDDTEIPDANHQVHLLGAFRPNNVTTEQHLAISRAVLPTVGRQAGAIGSQRYTFFLENKTGQSLPAAWELLVTPMTLGPSA